MSKQVQKDKSKILIVDDVPENLSVLSTLLQEEGYQVFPAISGELALQALETLQPDLMLLDIIMPGMNGFEVCEKIKHQDKLKEIPVIFISALDDPDDKIKAFSTGAVDYIGKPFNKEEVLARVNTHIELFRIRSELEISRNDLELEVKKRTQQLSLSERRLKQAQQLAHLGGWEMDVKSKSLHWTKEVYKIFGINPEEFSGSLDAFLDLVHPDDRAMVDEIYQKAIERKQDYDLVHRILRKDNGELRYVHEHSDQITDEQGNVIRSFGSVQDITDLITAEMERKLYLDKFKRALEQTILSVAATLEKRDPYTAGHQQNVSLLAEAIAREMGVSEEQIAGIRLGSSIHDIGKIHIPAEILNRPGKLSDPEFEMIRTHSMQGYEILKDVEFPWPIAEMILQHHERLDGRGYPNGLSADQIIPEAKILAVADVVEAMSSHRPYRPALGIEPALEEVEAGSGIRYDEQVVKACVSLFRNKGFHLESSM